MNIILFDTPERHRALLPLTFTRPEAWMRCGILTIREKWERRLGGEASALTVEMLKEKYPAKVEADNLFITGNLLPADALANAVANLAPGEALLKGDELIAYRGTLEAFESKSFASAGEAPEAVLINGPQDLFLNNGTEIEADFALLTAGRASQLLHPTCTLIGDPAKLFIEEGAECLCSTFNTAEGPIYIGKGAEVMEGCCLRGPIALCEHGVFKMGAKVYGGTTIGPYCKVGGEISNALFFGYANKAHDGFLGNAVIGEWCNLGAGCVSSNLKNDYSLIRLWSYSSCRFERTKMQFCGLIMGDHSKAGIQTMFNTATVVGVGCNIHGAGFPRTFIPSFSFGGAAGFERQRFDKFIETARTVMARRHVELTQADIDLLKALYALDDYAN